MTLWESQIALSPEEVVRHFIVRTFLFGCDDEFDRNASLHRTGILDSTGLLELITFLEYTFQITIADEELVPENFDTLGNVVRFLASKNVVIDPTTDLE